jgi:tripartite-type tricarboxylate transporter receptor subunit TctC
MAHSAFDPASRGREAAQIAARMTLVDVPCRGTATGQRRCRDGDKRVDALPATPTFAESGGSDLGRQHWYGLFGPTGPPASVLARLNRATVDAMPWRGPVHEGGVIETNSPAVFAEMIGEEREIWGAIIRHLGRALE